MAKPPKEQRERELANYEAQRERNEAAMAREAERQAESERFASLTPGEKQAITKRESLRKKREHFERQQTKSAAGPPENKALRPDLEDKSRDELYEMAQARGIEGRSSMTKAELVEALG